MSMTVLSQMSSSGSDFFSSARWRQIVESHLTWLRARNESDIVVVQPHVALKYHGDFYGALIESGVPQYLHWVTMRMNGLYSPTEFKGETVVLMVPSTDTIQQLTAVAGATNNKLT
jgi:hypothetical protein